MFDVRGDARDSVTGTRPSEVADVTITIHRALTGRIGSTKLKPGRYRATISATDAAKNRSKSRRTSFRVVRR